MVKLISLLKRKNGISHDEFSQYWYEKHGRMAYKVPNLRRYVQNHAIILPGTGEPRFDAIGEYWFDDLAAWKKSADFFLGKEGQFIRDDEEKFMDRSKIFGIVCDERIYIP